MIKIAVDFEKFPWFNGERRPVYVKGTAICRLVKLTEPTSFGDPCHVTWVIDRVECTIDGSKRAMIDFNGNSADRDDFRRWLAGRQGQQISRDLRGIAQMQNETQTQEAT